MIKEHSNLIYFIFILVLMYLTSMGLEFGLHKLGFINHTSINIVSLLIYSIIFTLGILTLAYKYGIKLKFNFTPINYQIVINVVFISVFIFFVQIAMDKLFFEELWNGKLKFIKFKNPFEFGLQSVFIFSLTVFIAPIAEELLYRRLLFRKLLEQYGLPFSMIMTSFLFALLHLSVEDFLAYFVISLVFTYVYHLTKTLWLNIILHAVYNLFSSCTNIVMYESSSSMFVTGIFIYVLFAYGVIICLKRIRFLT